MSGNGELMQRQQSLLEEAYGDNDELYQIKHFVFKMMAVLVGARALFCVTEIITILFLGQSVLGVIGNLFGLLILVFFARMIYSGTKSFAVLALIGGVWSLVRMIFDGILNYFYVGIPILSVYATIFMMSTVLQIVIMIVLLCNKKYNRLCDCMTGVNRQLSPSVSQAVKPHRKAERNMMQSDFVVRPPKWVFWVGMVCGLFFAAIMVLMLLFPNGTMELWMYLEFFLFILLGAFLAYLPLRWKIKVTDNEIRYTPLFGKEKTFTIGEIVKVKRRSQGLTAYSNSGKLFAVDFYYVGCSVLASRLESENIPFV